MRVGMVADRNVMKEVKMKCDGYAWISSVLLSVWFIVHWLEGSLDGTDDLRLHGCTHPGQHTAGCSFDLV